MPPVKKVTYDVLDPTRGMVAALAAVQAHPGSMSPVLLEYLLRGDIIGRMGEKGLLTSVHHGALSGATSHDVHTAITTVLARGFAYRGSGFYPALWLTPDGTAWLAEHQGENDQAVQA